MRDQNWAVGKRGYLNWTPGTRRNGWDQGDLYSPYGIVSVYAQGDDRFKPHTRLDFVKDGRCYTRSFDRRYSRRYCKTLALRFAKQMTEFADPTPDKEPEA